MTLLLAVKRIVIVTLMQTAAVDYFSNTLEYARNLTYKLWDSDASLSRAVRRPDGVHVDASTTH